MIVGVFLLARDPRALAEWYRRHLGWELGYLADEGVHYVELYYSEVVRPEQRQHLVFAIMPGDPGDPGQGHVVNYRVDDVDAIVARLHEDGVETTAVTVGPDAEGRASSSAFSTLKATGSSSGSISPTGARHWAGSGAPGRRSPRRRRDYGAGSDVSVE